MFPKPSRVRSRKLLDAACGEECTALSPVCKGNPATTVCAHSNLGEDGKGMGQKADDDITIYACAECHDWYDRSPTPRADKQAVFDRAFVRTYKRRKAQGIIEVKA